METMTLVMRTEHITNIAKPTGKLGIVSLVKEELEQFFFKLSTDLYVFIFGGREFQTDDPENVKLVSYRSIQMRSKT